MTSEVTAVIAKKLKSNNFDERCRKVRTFSGRLTSFTELEYSREQNRNSLLHQINKSSMRDSTDEFSYIYTVPTIVQTIMWMYSTHNIFIKPNVITINGQLKFFAEYNKINRHQNLVSIETTKQIVGNYDSIEELYLAAIDYTLDNLI